MGERGVGLCSNFPGKHGGAAFDSDSERYDLCGGYGNGKTDSGSTAGVLFRVEGNYRTADFTTMMADKSSHDPSMDGSRKWEIVRNLWQKKDIVRTGRFQKRRRPDRGVRQWQRIHLSRMKSWKNRLISGICSGRHPISKNIGVVILAIVQAECGG